MQALQDSLDTKYSRSTPSGKKQIAKQSVIHFVLKRKFYHGV